MEKPYLTRIKIDKNNRNEFPFSLPLFKNGVDLHLEKPITFIVGNNGSGKSTFLENLACRLGFNVYGGGKNNLFGHMTKVDNLLLSDEIGLTWTKKTSDGFFFRAESFLNFIDYLDSEADIYGRVVYGCYGGKSMQNQSHGEAFLSLFTNRFSEGIFILDEPESALSAERQLSLISILSELTKNNKCQFIIATHSPLLITLPGADIYEIDDGFKKLDSYKDTYQFNIYKDFLSCPERFLRHLCDD